nr:hypothetical protein [Staphylococcus epidermidis]
MDGDLGKMVKEKCEAAMISIGESGGGLCKEYQEIWGVCEDVEV